MGRRMRLVLISAQPSWRRPAAAPAAGAQAARHTPCPRVTPAPSSSHLPRRSPARSIPSSAAGARARPRRARAARGRARARGRRRGAAPAGRACGRRQPLRRPRGGRAPRATPRASQPRGVDARAGGQDQPQREPHADPGAGMGAAATRALERDEALMLLPPRTQLRWAEQEADVLSAKQGELQALLRVRCPNLWDFRTGMPAAREPARGRRNARRLGRIRRQSAPASTGFADPLDRSEARRDQGQAPALR